MSTFVSVGIIEKNSVAYVNTAFDLLEQGRIVAPLRSQDDHQRLSAANVSDVVDPESGGGWIERDLKVPNSSDIAHIAFTSGTEGEPKGVLISQTALNDVVSRVQSLMKMDSGVKEYIGVPVYHSFGYGRCRHVASVGGSFYIPSNGFNPREIAALLSAGEINSLSLVPSLLRVFLSAPDLLGEERCQLKWLEIGSQSMSMEEKLATMDLFPNANIVQHYGLTEASRTTLLHFNETPKSALSSVGKAFGDVQLSINNTGRICIKGAHIAKHILKQGELVSPTNAQGWFETSDLGHIKNDYLYFDGRADNVVNCGGQKLSTEVLELELLKLLSTSQGEIAVSRIPNPIYGEGFLVSYTAEVDESLLKRESGACLSALGVNAKNVLVFNGLSSIPKTHTGKTQYKKIADDYLDGLTEDSSYSEGGDLKSVFAHCLGVAASELDESMSVSDIGIDSIQSVQLSIKLESLLGYLPATWRDQSIAALAGLPREQKDLSDVSELKVASSGKAAPIWDGSSNMNPSGIGFWALIKEDFVTHDKDIFSQGLFAVFVHRFGNWRMGIRSRLFRAPMTILYRVLRKATQVFCGIKLDYTVHLGRRVKLEHFGGMILGARSIGDDTIVRQNTTFGIRDMSDLSAKPTIEKGVNIGAGVVIVGDIIVGRHSVIGPNSVVTESVPAFSIVSTASSVVTDLSAK